MGRRFFFLREVVVSWLPPANPFPTMPQAGCRKPAPPERGRKDHGSDAGNRVEGAGSFPAGIMTGAWGLSGSLHARSGKNSVISSRAALRKGAIGE